MGKDIKQLIDEMHHFVSTTNDFNFRTGRLCLTRKI